MCFNKEECVSKLLTTAVQPQPSKIYMLFRARSTENTHTIEEHSATVRSEFRGSIVICGQGLTYLPCEKKKKKGEKEKRARQKTKQKGIKKMDNFVFYFYIVKSVKTRKKKKIALFDILHVRAGDCA